MGKRFLILWANPRDALVSLVYVLMIVGGENIFSASFVAAQDMFGNGYHYLIRYWAFGLLGLVLMHTIGRKGDYHKIFPYVQRICVFLIGLLLFVDGYGKKLTSVLHVPEKVDYERLLKQNIISCSSVLIKRSLMLRYPMPCINDIHEDFATWLQMLKDENIVAYGIDEPLLIYRITRSSRSGNKWKAALMTFRTYRFIGLGVYASIKCWLFYALRSMRKYRKINP